ncbi:hypothetical protein JCM5296_000870 [Sporobolomyces johnsonii]
MLDKTESVVIVGAGTFGLSCAWHLAKSGYTNVTVIDRHEAPSIASAGSDLNKIFRTEYSEPLYSSLAKDARDVWLSEPLLKDAYHENGCDATYRHVFLSVANYEAAVANSVAQGILFEKLETPEAFRAKAPFLSGPMEGWRGVYNPKAGWTHARNALQALTSDCKARGVKFISGPDGTVKSLKPSHSGQTTIIEAESGELYEPSLIILAAGAWIDELIDTNGQLLAKCWCYAHITLSDEEAQAFKNMPVVNNRELGYMFEPDAEQNRLKVCPHTTGWTHYVDAGRTRSVPRSKAIHSTDTIPQQAEDEIRAFLRECIPSLADRPFSYSAMCWDSDSPDAHFIVDYHPDLPNLVVAGGASAHGFKFLPIIGAKIQDLIEGNLDPELAKLWRWRPGTQRLVDTSRPSKSEQDIQDMPGWLNDSKL